MYTTRRSAELIKYSANTFLATRSPHQRDGRSRRAGRRQRAGDRARHRARPPHRHQIPQRRSRLWRLLLSHDTRALTKAALDHDVQLRVVEATLTANDNRERAMTHKVAAAIGGGIRGKTIAVLGLPSTRYRRHARGPSIPLITGLLDFGARVKAHDPVGMEQAKKELTASSIATIPNLRTAPTPW